MQNEATDLIEERGEVTGVRAKTPDGTEEIRSHLVVGCDGRHSTTRGAAHFEVIETGVPIDVLWFRLPKTNADNERLLGTFNYGSALILIPRSDYYQAGLLIRKGSFEELKSQGLPAFQEKVQRISPALGEGVQELKSWSEVSLLSVQINRLKKWHRPGLLCIGDAAHAMSPVGGVGINLAIQDAIATANLLTRSLLQHNVREADLARVQDRRELPARVTQAVQALAHGQLKKVFDNPGPAKAPWQLKVFFSLPGLQRVVARGVGMGVLPEHVAGTARDSAPATSKKVAVVVGIVTAAAVFAGCWAGCWLGWKRASARRKLEFSRELI
jgi:2-polyprenyl-6-methoxyphenol hydroxylase-like FAD-dependent oxidoreductase